MRDDCRKQRAMRYRLHSPGYTWLGLRNLEECMPLPALPESNTVRYWLDYIVAGEQHSMQARAADTVDDSTAVSNLQTVAITLESVMGSNCAFLGVSKAAKNSNVRNTLGGFTQTAGTATVISDPARPFECGFAGRSSTGRKVRAFLFGVQGIAIPTTWAQSPITTAELQGFQGLLNSQPNFWLTIDGTKPVWYDKVTFGYNDHWIAVVRP